MLMAIRHDTGDLLFSVPSPRPSPSGRRRGRGHRRNRRDDTIGRMEAINIIRTDRQLAQFIGALGSADWVSIDTEFMRERTYAPLLCLIQVTGGGRASCIDPLAVEDLSPLGELLADPARSKIFHSCRQDLEALDTRLAVRARNLYDTQLAAAFCGYGDQVGYAPLVESMCAVRLPKAHTRADWSRRPLPAAQLQYAVEDVEFLHPIRRQLDRLLERKGCLEWHRTECAHAADPANHQFDPDTAWLKLKGSARLDAVGQACARKLMRWREHEARRRNLPRVWVMQDRTLIDICRKRPTTPAKLLQIRGVGPSIAKRYTAHILSVVADSKSRAPRLTRLPALNADDRRRAQQILSLIADLSEQTGISRTFIASRYEVENFVRGQTGLRLFQDWRLQLIGGEILARYS